MIPYAVVAAVVGMIWSTRAHVAGVVFGMPFSMPVLGIIAAVVGMLVLVSVLYLMVRLAAIVAECIGLRMVAT